VGLEDLQNALLSYIRALTIDPEQADTLMAVANICMDRLEYDLSLQYYLAAEQLDDTLEFIKLFIAVSYYKNGEVDKAIVYLRKAVEENESTAALFLELCPEAVNLNLLDQ